MVRETLVSWKRRKNFRIDPMLINFLVVWRYVAVNNIASDIICFSTDLRLSNYYRKYMIQNHFGDLVARRKGNKIILLWSWMLGWWLFRSLIRLPMDLGFVYFIVFWSEIPQSDANVDDMHFEMVFVQYYIAQCDLFFGSCFSTNNVVNELSSTLVPPIICVSIFVIVDNCITSKMGKWLVLIHAI